MKKIVFLGHTTNRGGASHVLTILANTFAGRGYEVELAFLRIINTYEVSDSVTVRELCEKDERISAINALRAVRKYLRSAKPDIVVSFTLPVNLIAITASAGLAHRLIISERNDPRRAVNPIRFLTSKLMYRMADAVVFQTEEIKNCFPKSVRKKGTVIRNPIEYSALRTKPAQKRISSVGKLYPQKNQALLIDAFRILHQTHPEYTLHIYGEGPLRQALQMQIENCGLNECVFLEGTTNRVIDVIANDEMFVLSSDYEGMSNALMEAMCTGLPVITTDVLGARELIQNGENGIIVPVGDSAAMADAMRELAENPALGEKLGRNARRLRECCDVNAVADEWQKLL